MTQWQQHVNRWTDCRLCGLCEGRKRVVLARGSVPAPILFCGEAPGQSEDIIGLPFVGPAGHLLDRIIEEAVGDHKYCVTNLVGCFPAEQKKGDDHAPPKDAIQACAPRLIELVRLCRPKLIVCVGSLARDWLNPEKRPHVEVDPSIRRVAVEHPAALLRMPLVNRGLAAQRVVVAIQNGIEEVGI